jgi:hypothetical protein
MAGNRRLLCWASLLCLVGLAAGGVWFAARRSTPVLSRVSDAGPPLPLSVEVRDALGPVADAHVRYQGDTLAVATDRQGKAYLPAAAEPSKRVTVSKVGYFIAGAEVRSPLLSIQLRRLPGEDAEDYHWVAPEPNPAQAHNCGNCHEAVYQEWANSGHARSARNRHFLNLYDGGDWSGRRQVGWNLLADHPDGAGVCTACHAPSVPFSDPAYYDLRAAQGPSAQGVHCDYCHKVADVAEGTIGLTHGRFGLRLLRPAQGQLFFGPLHDVDRGEDAYTPVYQDSRYCASCHEGTVFGVPVYTTYSEWLASPARREGKQCQTCHMTPTGRLTNLAPGHGGIERRPETLANHRFFAGSQLEMLRGCLKVDAVPLGTEDGGGIEVGVWATKVGHGVPTGFVDRQLLLVVEAFDATGKPVMPAKDCPTLPESAGEALAGLAGRLFAKQLSDFDGHRPVPFWRARPDPVDTRLQPGTLQRSRYTFGARVARARIRLLYRRFWDGVAAAKGWPDNELSVFQLHLKYQESTDK